jgi:hypothetical protein
MNWSKKPRDPAELGIKIQVEVVAMQKLWLWAGMAQGEVSALGLVEEILDEKTGVLSALRVTDFFLVEQICSSAETDMDPTAIAELLIQLEEAQIDGRQLRCWAHSHGEMGVFWSDTDDECIIGLANGEWLLSLVVNKKHETMMRLDQFHPCHLYVSDVVWEEYYPHREGLAEACLAEFRAKVTETSLLCPHTESIGVDHIKELKQAHMRGALTDEELEEEMTWLGVERDEVQPF